MLYCVINQLLAYDDGDFPNVEFSEGQKKHIWWSLSAHFEVAEQNEWVCTVWINDQNQKGIHRNTTFGWMNSHFIPSYFGGHRELATRPLVQVLHRGMCQQPGLFADCHSRPRAPSTVDFTGIHWISWDIEPWTNYMTFKWWQFHGKNQLHYVKLWQFGNMRTKRRCFSAESLGQSHIAEGSGRSFFLTY